MNISVAAAIKSKKSNKVDDPSLTTDGSSRPPAFIGCLGGGGGASVREGNKKPWRSRRRWRRRREEHIHTIPFTDERRRHRRY